MYSQQDKGKKNLLSKNNNNVNKNFIIKKQSI
jgi:hypothetical protein